MVPMNLLPSRCPERRRRARLEHVSGNVSGPPVVCADRADGLAPLVMDLTAVGGLVECLLGLRVAKVVKVLQNQNSEHHYRVVGLASSIAFALLLLPLPPERPERRRAYRPIEQFEGIALLVQGRVPFIRIKKPSGPMRPPCPTINGWRNMLHAAPRHRNAYLSRCPVVTAKVWLGIARVGISPSSTRCPAKACRI